jgi:hypothetical protein
MTEAELIELAKQHSLDLGMYPRPRMTSSADGNTISFKRPPGLTYYGEKLLEFGAAVAAAERERCAKVCEARAKHWDENTGCVRTPHVAVPQDGCDDCAAAIRKGETP